MFIKKALLTGAVAGSLLLTSITPVLAQNNSATSGGTTANHCTVVAGKIADAVTQSQNTQTQVAANLKKIEDLLKSKSATFQQKYGQDAYNTLTGDLNTLHNTYGTQVTSDWTTYTSDLTNLQKMSNQGDCGTTNGLFKTQLKQTKSDRMKVKSDVEAYKDYIRNTIIPYMKSLTPVSPTPAK